MVENENDIRTLVADTDNSRIEEHYMLFLFKTYEYEPGIIQCCEKYPNLTQELLNFYIKKDNKEKILEVCMRQKNPIDQGMWIQALTYFRQKPEYDGSILAF